MLFRRTRQPPKVLYAWELGANLGYVRPALPLLEHLQQSGAEVCAAIKTTTINAELLNQAGIGACQAPINVNAHDGQDQDIWNYQDLLRDAGFANVDILTGLVHAWRALFELSRATLLLAHHAPTAVLAAKTLGLSVQRVGTGFVCPPQGVSKRNFLPWAPTDPAKAAELEVVMLNSCNTVLSHFGASPVSSIDSVLTSSSDAGGDCLLSYPELDPYVAMRAQRDARYLGTLEDQEARRVTGVVNQKTDADSPSADWPTSDFAGVFAYLNPAFQDIQAVVEALKRVAAGGTPVAIFANGLGVQTRAQWLKNAPKHFAVLSRMAFLPEVLAHARLLVSHGSHGVCTAALRAGVPCLSFPRNAEQWLTSAAIAKLGAGKNLTEKLGAAKLMQCINEAANDAGLRACAQGFAQKYQPFSSQYALTSVNQVWQSLAQAA